MVDTFGAKSFENVFEEVRRFRTVSYISFMSLKFDKNPCSKSGTFSSGRLNKRSPVVG